MKHWSSIFLSVVIAVGAIYTKDIPQAYSQNQLDQGYFNKNTTFLEQKAIDTIGYYNNNKYEQIRSQLEEPLKVFWTPEKLRKEWEKYVIEKNGKFIKILSTKHQNIVNGYLVILNIEFTKGKEIVIFTFNKQGEIAGINFPPSRTVNDIAKTFVEYTFTQKYASARNFLHPYLKVEIFPKTISNDVESFEAKTGKFKKVLSVSLNSASSDQDLAIVKAQFENGVYSIFVVFDKQKNIIGVNIPQK